MKPLPLIFALVLPGCANEQSAQQVAAAYCAACEMGPAELCVTELASDYEEATVCDAAEGCVSCGSEWMSEYQCRASADCVDRPPECREAQEAFADCSAERSGLSIVAILSRDDRCQVDAGSSDELDRGLYDVAYPANYFISALLESSRVRDAERPGREPANVQVQSYTIALLLPDETPLDLPEQLYSPFSTSTSAILDENEAIGDVTREVGAAIGIPLSYQDALKQAVLDRGGSTVILEIYASGTTSGGARQRSPRIRLPVDLCEGCLESCPAQGGQPCQPGQDGESYCAQ